MAFDLYAPGGRAFQVGPWDWHPLLNLARQYGWQPEGTGPPTEWVVEQRTPWPADNYHTNNHQWVSSTDARALAEALERALADIPEGAPTPGERFSGEGRGCLRAFIRFAQEGGFAIG